MAKVGGRKAGTPNKIGAALKDNVWKAFIKLNGADGMVKWANACNANKTEFYRICSKIIPTESHNTTEVSRKDVRELSTEELTALAREAALEMGASARDPAPADALEGETDITH